MARPSRCRRICAEPDYCRFGPWGRENGELVLLSVDEYEAIRLVDYEGKTHEQCAGQMGISRTTVTEICQRARKKIADCLVNGKQLYIAGGNYRVCEGKAMRECGRQCMWSAVPAQPEKTKGEDSMKLAVTYEDGMVFQHFGHTRQMKLYEVEDGRVVRSEVVDTTGSGHGALAGFLVSHGVDTLICGGIGGGAQVALAQAGIRLYGGVGGSADEAVAALLAGSLDYNPEVHCDHHDHEEGHSCGHGAGGCGEDKHGCPGNGGSCGG